MESLIFLVLMQSFYVWKEDWMQSFYVWKEDWLLCYACTQF